MVVQLLVVGGIIASEGFQRGTSKKKFCGSRWRSWRSDLIDQPEYIYFCFGVSVSIFFVPFEMYVWASSEFMRKRKAGVN